MWVLRVELASCHPSGTYNFEVAPRYLENLFTPALNGPDLHTVGIHPSSSHTLNFRYLCYKGMKKISIFHCKWKQKTCYKCQQSNITLHNKLLIQNVWVYTDFFVEIIYKFKYVGSHKTWHQICPPQFYQHQVSPTTVL